MTVLIENELSQHITAVSPDGSLTPIGKLAAHQYGVHHLAVSVFIISGDSMLIQQRARDKYHSGGLWANACCSHPAWGETVEDCAERRVMEELGVSVRLELIGDIDYIADVGNGLIESEHVSIFIGRTNSTSLDFNLNPTEVSATRWVNIKELQQEIDETPDCFTAWFKQYMTRTDPPLVSVRALASANS